MMHTTNQNGSAQMPNAPRVPPVPKHKNGNNPVDMIKGMWASKTNNTKAELDHASASWDLAVACIYLAFVVLIWVFFYKILFAAGGQCKQIPWYGFGIFLFVLCTISVLFAIAFLITSSIRLSEAEQAKK